MTDPRADALAKALHDYGEFEDDGPPVRYAAVLLAALNAAGWDLVRRDALDAAYRERNAVVAALFRTNGWPVYRIDAPDAPGWFIVYAETPAGQVSWHISPDDIGLFDPPVAAAEWDGHTTEEKYRRIADLVRREDTLTEAWEAAQALPEAEGRKVFLDKSTPGSWYANIRHEKGWTVWYMPGNSPEAALRALVTALDKNRAALAAPATEEEKRERFDDARAAFAESVETWSEAEVTERVTKIVQEVRHPEDPR